LPSVIELGADRPEVRSDPGSHITNVPCLVVESARITCRSKECHACITVPKYLGSVPKYFLDPFERVTLQNIKPLVLCRMPLHGKAEIKPYWLKGC